MKNGIDKAEKAIVNALEQMDVSTAKWLLSVKGKDRGYTGTDSDTLIFRGNREKILL